MSRFAGAVFAYNSVQVVGTPQDGTTYELDGVEYPASLVGTITGSVGWEKSIAPYVGIGFSKRPQGKGWGAYINGGVMDAGPAVARLEATGADCGPAGVRSRFAGGGAGAERRAGRVRSVSGGAARDNVSGLGIRIGLVRLRGREKALSRGFAEAAPQLVVLSERSAEL